MKIAQSLGALLLVSVILSRSSFAQTLQPEEIVRKSLETDRLNFQRGKDYTYIQKVITRELDKDGKVRKVESETFDVMISEGRPYQKLIAKDGKPLTEKEAKKASQEFEEELAKRKSESPEQRRKSVEKREKERAEGRALLQEIPNAFTLKLAGETMVDGIPAWIIDAEPRAGFKSKVKRADLLPKFKGRIWIDQREFSWVKVEAQTVAPVSFGWVVARLEPGAILTFRQARVNGQVWMPVQATTKLDARIALLKKYRAEVDVLWSEYRKFQTDSRVILSSPEAEEPKQIP